MMPGSNFGKAREHRLAKRFRALNAADQDALEAFAEFLAQRRQSVAGTQSDMGATNSPMIRVPEVREPRPERESVIAAMKRLRRTYPQLDVAELLDEASLLMSAHMLQGRPAPAIIDELEALFARHAGLLDGAGPDGAGPEGLAPTGA